MLKFVNDDMEAYKQMKTNFIDNRRSMINKSTKKSKYVELDLNTVNYI